MAADGSRVNWTVQSGLAAGADPRHLHGMAQADETESPKRRAVLDAATELFAARGYGAVSMDAIARAADVSKATLYAYFDSKDQLFATIVQSACREHIMPDDALLGDGKPEGAGDVEAALRAIGGRVLRFFLNERTLAIHRLVIAESARFPELGRAFYENGPVAGREMMAAWMVRQPALTVPEPEIAAEQFLGLLRTGLYLRATLGLVPEPAEAVIDATVAAAVGTFVRAYGHRFAGPDVDANRVTIAFKRNVVLNSVVSVPNRFELMRCRRGHCQHGAAIDPSDEHWDDGLGVRG